MSLLQGPQSALAPFGPEAAGIAQTAWMLFIGAAVIFAIVLALAWLAWRREPRWLASRSAVVFGGIVFPTVVLSALLVHSLLANPRLLAASSPPELTVLVTGEQWWWRVQYLDADGRPDFATANEIRLPVGGVVEVRLHSADVLHSFWVPSLAGKLDAIPGRENRLLLVAEQAGTWRGQCAEFCGGPHAQMALYVVAAPPAEFERWRSAQREDASFEASSEPGAGLFAANCAVCHAVRGTGANGTLGPDLTHVASRESVGAGILPGGDAVSFERWIADNQSIKPGNLMPQFDALGQAEVRALAAYLARLE
jgi:cytochrome c oxidase subunit 2